METQKPIFFGRDYPNSDIPPLYELRRFRRTGNGYFQILIPTDWVERHVNADQDLALFAVVGTDDLIIRPAQNPNKTTVNDNSNISEGRRSGNGDGDRDGGQRE